MQGVVAGRAYLSVATVRRAPGTRRRPRVEACRDDGAQEVTGIRNVALEKKRLIPLMQLLAAFLGCTAAVVVLLREKSTLRALLAGVCLGLLVYVLYYLLKLRPMYRALGGSGFQGARKRLAVTTETPRGERKTLEVRRLVSRRRADARVPLQLNWLTFLRGCHELARWMKRRVSPALYVGVDRAGVVIAGYIRSRLSQENTPLVAYHTSQGRPGEEVSAETRAWPPPDGLAVGPLLIVDSVIHTGWAVSRLAERLRGQYGDGVELWYVGLVVCGVSAEDVETARRKSQTPPGRPVPLEEVLSVATGGTVRGEPNRSSFAISPQAIAYVSSGPVKLPFEAQ